MAIQLTSEDARQSMNAHVAAKGAEIFEKYGPHIGFKELKLILKDTDCVRYPCELVFDAAPLMPGETAHPEPLGDTPEAGFRLCVHPYFLTRLDVVPMLVLYQLVLVNYGEFASADDAEIFGSRALGLCKDEYYQAMCALSDQLGGMGCA